MKNDSERLNKVSNFSKSDIDSIRNLLSQTNDAISEGKEISEKSIALLDRAILEILQMRKRHVIVYMSLLKRGYTE